MMPETIPMFDAETAGHAAADPRITERVMLDLLHQRFGFISHNGGVPKPRYVCAEHVRARSGFDTRTLDFVAVDTWASGKLATHGVEIKVSRPDWLRELKDPHKSEPFLAWTTHFWLAAADAGVAREDELPEGWGLLVVRGSRLVARVTPPRREVAPIPPESLASLLYAVQRTAARRHP
jgi:hypothetical protein